MQSRATIGSPAALLLNAFGDGTYQSANRNTVTFIKYLVLIRSKNEYFLLSPSSTVSATVSPISSIAISSGRWRLLNLAMFWRTFLAWTVLSCDRYQRKLS